MNNIESQKGEIVMYQPDETIRLEVRMGEETVWLTQQQMADLFNKDRSVIGRHIRNIYKEEELEKDITCAKFAHMGKEGDQPYEYTAYNLDVIISVGGPLIVEASWAAIQRDLELGAYYSNCCQIMKPHKAIIKVARKLACRAYAVLKTKTRYVLP